MPDASSHYHEPLELLDPATREHHRALVSLMEELEAIDWYQQRINATADEELKALLAHNRDEEKEHAARKLVDFSGPHGWDHSAVNLGRFEELSDAPADDVEARLRRVQPLVEFRAPFELSLRELDNAKPEKL